MTQPTLTTQGQKVSTGNDNLYKNISTLPQKHTGVPVSPSYVMLVFFFILVRYRGFSFSGKLSEKESLLMERKC